jgi:uncharacterized protein YbbK (DUF523 family)
MLLLSSCLAGFPVRYDGGTATRDLAMWLVARGQALTVCPEVMSGLSTPREPAEIVGGTAANVLSGSARILTRSGTDVTDNFLRGAHMALGIALKNHVRAAFLKDKSPSCGAARVYDGSFTGTKITGLGVTAQLLTNNGISARHSFPRRDHRLCD